MRLISKNEIDCAEVLLTEINRGLSAEETSIDLFCYYRIDFGGGVW